MINDIENICLIISITLSIIGIIILLYATEGFKYAIVATILFMSASILAKII